MITEIVRFDLPPDMPRAKVVELFGKTVPTWQGNTALIRKQYLYDAKTNTGGGIYLWTDIAAAKAAHNSAWCDLAQSIYGSRPTISYFETPLLIDNLAKTVLHAP